MELIPGSETSTHLIQMPGLHPKEYTLHQQHGESLKTKMVNLAASKNLAVKSMMYPHRDIHKYTWYSPDGKTDNQIDLILIGRRWRSSILNA
jgi:hypothetical protein